MSERVIVTGGAGFIGSALVRYLIQNTDSLVLNIDKLTYAGDLTSLAPLTKESRYQFERLDICDQNSMLSIFENFKPTKIIHLAAESHVDNSITGPKAFIETNIFGTFALLEATKLYFQGLKDDAKKSFKFLHVSTDEVYGHLGHDGFFTESSPYRPNSPYSSSKAASDHLARAWSNTYKLPIVISNCSNNYGPWQFPEKLMPVIINRALKWESIPIYGQGANVRDWLYVDDHVSALWLIANKADNGETFLIGGHNERTNLAVAQSICAVLNELRPHKNGGYENLITFVTDRLGHDFRYAIDPTKLTQKLGWKPLDTFETGLKKTVSWYLEHTDWCDQVSKKRKVF